MSPSNPEFAGDSQGAAAGSNINFNPTFFESKQIRHNFIKKVYSILTIQLLITTCIIAVFALQEDVKAWALQNRWFQHVAFIVAFVMLIGITCMGELRRKHPHNLIVLFGFTVAESLMLSAITVMFNTRVIVYAGGLTILVCLALTLFAFQTKYDLTLYSGAMVIVLLVAVVAMIIFSLAAPSQRTSLIFACILAVIMGIFLIIDTQMIIGGTHSIQMSPEEYVFASINLYLDIINMFLYILMILGRE